MNTTTAAKNDTGKQLYESIQSKNALVGVVGLGYVGLPLIHAFVQAGFQECARRSETRPIMRCYL